MAIYTDSSGPHSLVASSSEQTLIANNWNCAPLTTLPNLAANTTYWLAYQTNGSAATYNNLSYTTGSLSDTATVSQAYGTFLNPFPGSPTLQARDTSLYVTN